MTRPALQGIADETALQVAEYVCGLLTPVEHAQVHALLSQDDEALAHALAWEEELLSLVDALPRVNPEPTLRERLQNTLDIGPPPAPHPPPSPQLLRRPSDDSNGGAAGSTVALTPAITAIRPSISNADTDAAAAVAASTPKASDQVSAAEAAPETRAVPADPVQAVGRRKDTCVASTSQRILMRKLWFWRLIGLCAASAAVVGFMLPSEPPPPPVNVIKVAPTRAAILMAPGTTSTPGWTATLDPQGNLMMQPLVHTQVDAGTQALLWTRSAKIPQARLLGSIDPNRPIQVPAAQLGALADDQLLEITLESDADAAKGVPNGPILFIGRMTVFGSEGATPSGLSASGSVGEATASGGEIEPGR